MENLKKNFVYFDQCYYPVIIKIIYVCASSTPLSWSTEWIGQTFSYSCVYEGRCDLLSVISTLAFVTTHY